MAPEPLRSSPSRRRLNVPAPQSEGSAATGGRSAPPPLSGFRVVDLSTWIAGAYCTKLLADGGAEVIKVESSEGDPLRRWSASGTPIPADDDGALFNFLGASKRSVVIDGTDAGGLDALHGLVESADAVVWSQGARLAEQPSLDPRELLRAHPHLIVTSLTAFGLDGPWSGRPATEFTLQAWSGGIVGLARGKPERAPVFVGGQIGEWLAGLYGAIGTLAARRGAASGGELVDVSMLEALAMCLTYYPVTFNDQLGRPMRRKRFVATPGVGAASDGLVGLGCGTGQQWLDFCVLVGHPEWMEDQSLFLDRTALTPTIDAWIADRTVEEVLQEASAFRIPNAPITNGANAATWAHFCERGTFVANPRDGATNPRPPFRLGAGSLRAPEAAPRLGELTVEEAAWPERPVRPVRTPSKAVSRVALRGTADPGHDVVLGRASHRSHVGAPRRRGHPPGVRHPTRRGPPRRWCPADGRPVLGARPDLRRAQHQQEEPDRQPERTARPRAGAEPHRDVRRGHRELHAAGAGPTGSGLRVPARWSDRISSWCACPDSGSTGRAATCRPSPSSSRTPPVSPGSPGTRTCCRSSPTASVTPMQGCTRCTACCWPSSTASGPVKAAWWRRRWSMLRSTSQPSNRLSSRPTARCSNGPGTAGPRRRRRTCTRSQVPTSTSGTTAGSPSPSPPTSSGAPSDPPWAIRRGRQTPSS